MSFGEAQTAELLAALRRDAAGFGSELARAAHGLGLAVTSKTDGSTRPIPITATPVVIGRTELVRRGQLSAHLASAGFKMSRAMLAGDDRELLLAALSPLERRVAQATFAASRTLATTRVDYFVGAGGRPWAL